MLAIDTNVIVRYLTGDDAEQFAKARALIRDEDVNVCTTVLLETEWVLRRGYRFSRERVIAALAAFAGLPRVTLQDAELTAKTLDWAQRCISRKRRNARRSSASTSASRRLPLP
jgi:predicted nucleic-acid-binding protein